MDLTPKSQSEFRMWVHRLWIENIEEHLTYGEKPNNINEYWGTYKYWLKREFKHQRSKND